MAKKVKETVIIVPNADEMAGILTSSRKWINRLEKLEAAGHAEEVESSVSGAREWEIDKSLIRLPFYRKPRTYTDEEREAARERLVGVRAAVQARREEDEEEAPKKKKKAKKKKAKPKPVEVEVEDEDEDWEEDEDIEDDDLDEDDEEEVVVVKKSKSKSKKRKRKR